jgi:molybdopterin-guanine dinucleotide biosynthesis protein A
MPSDARPAPHSSAPVLRWDAIVVAGGRATRLGGIDKTALVWHGRSLLDGVLAAVSCARQICVVGSPAPLPAAVLRTVEEPRWGGPAAAIVAGLTALGVAEPPDAPGWIVVLAGDLVRADEATAVLLAEARRVTASVGTDPDRVVDGVIGVDSDGRRQPLLAAYRRESLMDAARRAGTAENFPVTRLIGHLTLSEVRLPDALSDDVDTPADAARLGIRLPGGSAPAGTAAGTPAGSL